ncbi:GntR family transcriptional regulator [Bradyrhizobium liaoningense]|uniref:GntR family transcriptional regulator n=1 Tax=Bradyrhizobium liaoningense TaxID=43992 RepID=UPI001BAD1E90|nr:GntR family transcriptional regulator [Bradyrhizobium liaoningense]MBR1167530.1 GntR family transcriptional regulator [Bradyrhizobium liaoningense]
MIPSPTSNQSQEPLPCLVSPRGRFIDPPPSVIYESHQPKSRGESGGKPAKPQHPSLTELAYARIEQIIATRIAARRFRLGGGALDMGRTPVREAIQRLAREHLLRIMPRKGCVVSDFRFGHELHVIEVRRDLEQVAARAAALRATAEQRRQFAEIADGMTAALEAEDFEGFARLDAEFNQLCLSG